MTTCMMRPLLLAVALTASCHSPAPPFKDLDDVPHGEFLVESPPGECALCDVYYRARSYVVLVQTDRGFGTGFFVDPRGDLVTNAHVVAGHTVVKVLTSDGAELEGEVLRSDSAQDLALIRVKGGPFNSVDLSRSTAVRVGSEVFAIGHPVGLHWTLSRGIVSALRTRGEMGAVDYIQTDAAISPGNSGGPLLDRDGRLVGIVTAKIVNAETDNLAFARPLAAVLRFITQKADESPSS